MVAALDQCLIMLFFIADTETVTEQKPPKAPPLPLLKKALPTPQPPKDKKDTVRTTKPSKG